MSTATQSISTTAINTIRTLAMDAVEKANSGHPGTPMALAPIAYKLWADVLRYDPAEPLWPNRDRYVLSCGPASMLFYSLIHLAGVVRVDEKGNPTSEPSLTLDDLKQFRQLHSRTPGHPEYHHTTGVETTTGPLGQGCGNSVGMAMASKWLAATYNKDDIALFDFNVYVQCSDGDLMEGVACEAASLAGHLKLDNLCWMYDDNRITIEGDTDLAFTEDVGKKFEGLGWNVLHVADANDTDAIGKAIATFQATKGKPTLIVIRSEIAWGAPNAVGTHGAHGAPLGAEEISLTKKAYGWPDEAFVVPDEVPEHFAATLGQRGADASAEWNEKFKSFKKKYASEAAQIEMMLAGKLPEGWDKDLPTFSADAKGMATRASGGKSLNAIAKNLPWMIGGSADLAPSTKTLIDGADSFSHNDFGGRNLHFGIREHAMAAAVNGMAICGLKAYGATFFVFSDYLRPSMRLSALMKLPAMFVFTHDSIGVGEDGPTHQPVEQLAACRGIPNLLVLRPGDANECAAVWKLAVEQTHRPSALVLTRQNLPTLDRTVYADVAGAAKGAYVLAESDKSPQAIIMASGSELCIAVEAYEKLKANGEAVRLVSVPSMELFNDQPASYRNSVLPPTIAARVAIEAGIRQPWDRYLGLDGTFIGMDDFGASAPYEQVYAERGITSEAIVAAVNQLVG